MAEMSCSSMHAAAIMCIAGMHRSGTSLTAAWLDRCGLAIHDGEVVGPTAANPKGHFEDKEFVDLHASAITSVAPGSYGWKTYAKDFLLFDACHAERALQLVVSRNSAHTMWGWKDPRTVVFLTSWKLLVPELKVLLVWRPYTQVVASLIRRSRVMRTPRLQLTLLDALRLWISYNQKVCTYKRQFADDCVLLSLDDVLKGDRAVFDLLRRRFRLQLAYSPITDVYDPALLQDTAREPVTSLLGRLLGSDQVEQSLRRLSDTSHA